MTDPKVFIVHKSTGDFSFEKAQPYGEQVIMFDGAIPLGRGDDGINEAKIRGILTRFEFKEGDYILLSGTKLLNAMVMVEASRRVYTLRILCYIKAADRYTLHEIAGNKER